MTKRRGSALEAPCRICAVGVDLHTAAQTGGYCRHCAPALPGMEHAVTAQVGAAAEHSGAELTAEMRQPAGHIGGRGIEFDSPLFGGQTKLF